MTDKIYTASYEWDRVKSLDPRLILLAIHSKRNVGWHSDKIGGKYYMCQDGHIYRRGRKYSSEHDSTRIRVLEERI